MEDFNTRELERYDEREFRFAVEFQIKLLIRNHSWDAVEEYMQGLSLSMPSHKYEQAELVLEQVRVETVTKQLMK